MDLPCTKNTEQIHGDILFARRSRFLLLHSRCKLFYVQRLAQKSKRNLNILEDRFKTDSKQNTRRIIDNLYPNAHLQYFELYQEQRNILFIFMFRSMDCLYRFLHKANKGIYGKSASVTVQAVRQHHQPQSRRNHRTAQSRIAQRTIPKTHKASIC